MSTSTKILICLGSLLLISVLGFVAYKQHEISERQLAIQTQIISQKDLIDNITRSSNQYATKDDINKFINDNGINLKAIEDDLSKLHAEINTANIITVNSSKQTYHNLPSTNTGPNNPNPNTIDTYGYLKKTQLLDLHENFGKTEVPIGQVGFSAWQQNPWNLTILPRDYKITNVIGVDENQKNYVYNKVSITVDNKDYDVQISSATTKQEYPSAKWSFTNPKLFLGANVGVNIQQPVVKASAQLTPDLTIGLISYGQFKNNPDLSFAQVGMGVGLADIKPQVVIIPIAYRLKSIPFISNTYIAPSLGIGFNGSINIGAGLRVGL